MTASLLLRRLLRRRAAVAALVVLAVIVVAALLAPLLASHDPNRTDLLAVYKEPSGAHRLGTDNLGRDLYSRLLYGARTSLVAAIEAVGVSVALGVPTGLVAGYRRGRLDLAFSRLNDAIMSVPNLILALAIVAVLGPGLNYAMLAIGLVFTPRVFRVVRAATMEVEQQTFIEGSEAIGCTSTRTVVVHVLPNVLSPLLVVVSVSLGTAILAEASLSFLGLGVKQPTASWGQMLADAGQRLDLGYLFFPPAIALFATIAAFTVLGDAVRDSLGAERRSEHA